jgi:hypothetical protein
MHPFRVFVSYAREDRELAATLVARLRDANLQPLWDQDIAAGVPFSDEIKGLIAHSHLFMPLITELSESSAWVHQETGFAIAMRIPILPIIVDADRTPNVFIASLQAVLIDCTFANLGKKLQEINLEHLVLPIIPRPTSFFEVAEWPEKRTELLVEYTARELQVGNYGLIRQKAAFSSFYIPHNMREEMWGQLDGEAPRSEYYHYLLSEERRTLGMHVEQQGCSLIINPTVSGQYCGDAAMRCRLEKLLEFLEAFPDEKIKVVLSYTARRNNLTIVGDWFAAESRIPSRQGYRHTIFTFHPPTVLRRIRQFDDEFDKICKEQEADFQDCSSRKHAIAQIKNAMRS